MNWFYALNGAQKGPVDEAEFDRLVQVGRITATTLVWREGMADWQPYAQAAAGSSARPEVACVECGRRLAVDETIRLGSGYVCADCKVVALQKLREGISAGGDSEQLRREHLKHEASVRSVGSLYFVIAAFFLFTGIFGLVTPRAAAGWVTGVILLGIAGMLIWVGVGLRYLRAWARIPAGIVSGFGLLATLLTVFSRASITAFGFGALINAYVLYLVFSRKGLAVFSVDYQRIIRETPHIKYRTSSIIWVLVGAMAFLFGLGLLAALFGRR